MVSEYHLWEYTALELNWRYDGGHGGGHGGGHHLQQSAASKTGKGQTAEELCVHNLPTNFERLSGQEVITESSTAPASVQDVDTGTQTKLCESFKLVLHLLDSLMFSWWMLISSAYYLGCQDVLLGGPGTHSGSRSSYVRMVGKWAHSCGYLGWCMLPIDGCMQRIPALGWCM